MNVLGVRYICVCVCVRERVCEREREREREREITNYWLSFVGLILEQWLIYVIKNKIVGMFYLCSFLLHSLHLLLGP